jgi:hypothetical protein
MDGWMDGWMDAHAAKNENRLKLFIYLRCVVSPCLLQYIGDMNI